MENDFWFLDNPASFLHVVVFKREKIEASEGVSAAGVILMITGTMFHMIAYIN